MEFIRPQKRRGWHRSLSSFLLRGHMIVFPRRKSCGGGNMTTHAPTPPPPPPSVDIKKNISNFPYAFLAYTGTISPAVSSTYLPLQ